MHLVHDKILKLSFPGTVTNSWLDKTPEVINWTKNLNVNTCKTVLIVKDK